MDNDDTPIEDVTPQAVNIDAPLAVGEAGFGNEAEQEELPGMLVGIPTPESKVLRIDDLPDGPQLPNDELRTSIQTFGVVLEPIVFERPDGGYMVASGSRTVVAARDVGIEEVPCCVYPPDAWPYFAAIRLGMNTNRSPNPIAELDAILALLASGLSEKDIAAQVGIPSATVTKRLSLASLLDDLRIGLQTNHIPLSIAERCARLNREQQDMLVEIYNEKGKLTSKDVSAVIELTTPLGSKPVQAALPENKDWRKEIRKATLVAMENEIPLEALLEVVRSAYDGISEDED